MFIEIIIVKFQQFLSTLSKVRARQKRCQNLNHPPSSLNYLSMKPKTDFTFALRRYCKLPGSAPWPTIHTEHQAKLKAEAELKKKAELAKKQVTKYSGL